MYLSKDFSDVCRQRMLLRQNKEGNPAICNDMDEPGKIMLSALSQAESDKQTNTVRSHSHVESKKVQLTEPETRATATRVMRRKGIHRSKYTNFQLKDE